MFSLSNIFFKKELKYFINHCNKECHKKKIEFLAEPKFDGLSISLTYQFGSLIKATTRGDGIYGEIITNKIERILNLL